MPVIEVIAFIVAVPFLLLMVLLASIAFRGGERAGYHRTAGSLSIGGVRGRRTRINPVNQVFVWGLALTLMAATVAMLVASFAYDSWVWL
ncbi:MAG: hypothetical protein AB7I38_12615 [Dehalococcoidia bacterium]